MFYLEEYICGSSWQVINDKWFNAYSVCLTKIQYIQNYHKECLQTLQKSNVFLWVVQDDTRKTRVQPINTM